MKVCNAVETEKKKKTGNMLENRGFRGSLLTVLTYLGNNRKEWMDKLTSWLRDGSRKCISAQYNTLLHSEAPVLREP